MILKQTFIILFLFSFSTLAQQYEIVDKTSTRTQSRRVQRLDNFKCSIDSNKLSLLKQYIMCQTSPFLGACGTIGAFVAGRTVTKKLIDKVVSDFELNRSKFVNELAAQLHEDMPREISTKDEVLKKHREIHAYYQNSLDNLKKRSSKVAALLKETRYSSDDMSEVLKLTKKYADIDEVAKLESLSLGQTIDESDQSLIRRLLTKTDVGITEKISLRSDVLSNHRNTIEILSNSSPPFYKPKIAADETFIFDTANEKYRNLPELGRRGFIDDAQVVYNEILSRLKTGKPLDSEFIEQASTAIYDEKYKIISSTRISSHGLSQAQTNESRAIVRKGIDQFTSSFIKGADRSLVERLASQLAKTGAVASSRTIGFLLGGGSLVAEVGFFGLTYSSSTGCSSLTDSYLNAQGTDCEPAVGISNGVLNFLDLPADQQEQFLNINNGKFCKFYEDLYAQTFNQSIENVSCMGRSIEVKMYDTKYGQYSSHIHFREDGSIEKIGSIIGKGSILHQIDQEGKDVRVTGALLENGDAPLVARAIQANKLYAHEIASCCQSNPAEQQECLRQFNTSKTQRMIEDLRSKSISEGAR